MEASGSQAQERDHLLSDKAYKALNFCAVVAFPAAGTLYFGLAQIWNLPSAEEVVGSIVVVDTFLGALLKTGEASYKNSDARFDGDIHVTQKPSGVKSFELALNTDPHELDQKDEITFKVIKPAPSPTMTLAPVDQPAPPVETPSQ